jgi:hypothetical protein
MDLVKKNLYAHNPPEIAGDAELAELAWNIRTPDIPGEFVLAEVKRDADGTAYVFDSLEDNTRVWLFASAELTVARRTA